MAWTYSYPIRRPYQREQGDCAVWVLERLLKRWQWCNRQRLAIRLNKIARAKNAQTKI